MFDTVMTGKDDYGILTLAGELSIMNVERIREALLNVISRYDNITVRLDNVEKLDFPCIQLFCAAHKSARKQGKSLIVMPSEDDAPNIMKRLVYSGFAQPNEKKRGAYDTRGFVIKEED